METLNDSLLTRLQNSNVSHLPTVHTEIFSLSEEELDRLSLDLIPALFHKLLQDPHFTSLHTLEYVVTKSAPKEALLCVLEFDCTSDADARLNSTVFLLYLKMLALLLNKLPSHMLSYAFSTHNAKFLQLIAPLSDEHDTATDVWEGEEVEWLLSLHSIFEIDFKSYQLKLINAVQSHKFKLNTLLISNSLFLSSLSSLKQTPLPYLDRQLPSSLPYQFWLSGLALTLHMTHRDVCTQFLFNKILRCGLKAILALTEFSDLCDLFCSGLSQEEGKEEMSFNRLVKLGVSQYIFLSISHPQRLLLDPVPLCLSRQYLYECMCPVSCVFLSHSSPHITSIGLSLSQRVGKLDSLGVHCAWESHGELCYLLTQVMLYSEEEQRRREAVLLFKTLFSRYSAPLLHWLYRLLLWRVRQPPAVGFLVSSLKEQIHRTLSELSNERVYFTGPHLLTLLKRVIRLGDTQPSGLIQETDSILSCLNLLRYLLLRDAREKNLTHIWSLLPRIDKYCSHLSYLVQEALHCCTRDLEMYQRGTNADMIPVTSMLQQDFNRLALTQDLNVRLREILTQSVTIV